MLSLICYKYVDIQMLIMYTITKLIYTYHELMNLRKTAVPIDWEGLLVGIAVGILAKECLLSQNEVEIHESQQVQPASNRRG